uniref:Uncharacterized protein n=1 Tax=Hucho hucho TaxID=62062 RepID=A0A4W5RY50_9TELE
MLSPPVPQPQLQSNQLLPNQLHLNQLLPNLLHQNLQPQNHQVRLTDNQLFSFLPSESETAFCIFKNQLIGNPIIPDINPLSPFPSTPPPYPLFFASPPFSSLLSLSPPIVTCPPNAEYIECGPACIPSCKEPSTNCTGSCISACFCKPGFVFKGRRCVPIETCGCLEGGDYYEPGEIIFGDGCSKLCRCAGNYILDCVDNSCSATEECRNGACYPKGTVS